MYESFSQRMENIPAMKTIVVVGIFFPIFFQLPFNLYNDSKTLLDSRDGLTRLPIPFSVIACFIGILCYGGFRRKTLAAWIWILSSFLLMMLTSIIVSEGEVPTAKWNLLIFQYMFPMFAFIYGYAVENTKQVSTVVERGVFISVGLIVPLQLASTWIHRAHYFPSIFEYQSIIKYIQHRSIQLWEQVFFFTIYQPYQYVPCILIGAFFFSLFGLWNNGKARYFLFPLTPFIGVYAVASASRLALAFYLIGLCWFALYFVKRNHLLPAILLLILSLFFTTGYFLCNKGSGKSDTTFISKKFAIPKFNDLSNFDGIKQDQSVSTRIDYWRFYLDHITESAYFFFFGHPEQPDIKKIPSAHNYYLDFMYNFGFLAMTPLFFATIATVVLIIQNIKSIYNSPSLFGLTISVLFLLFVDNQFKVGMRQLYPGIATFFLWGLLTNRLQSIEAKDANKHGFHQGSRE